MAIWKATIVSRSLREASRYVIMPASLMKTTPTHRALLLMIASATFFGFMAFPAKLASARLSGPEVAMIRFLVGLTPVLLIPKYRRAAMTFQRLDLLLLRGFFGGVAV